jgi:hypothetical protein
VAGEVGEGTGSPLLGSGSGQGHWRGAIHGGAARRRGYSTPARNYTWQRAIHGSIGAEEVPYLKAGSRDSSAATETRRWPGSTVAAARRTTGERGQREIGRGRGNGCAFRVADVGAELTGAKGEAELQRRRGTELGTAGVMAAALCVRAARGREGLLGANGGEGEGEWGSGHKWPRARWGEFHARRGRGGGGREQLGGGYAGTTGLTSRARNAEGEKKAGAGAREAGLTGRTHGQRESEGAGARGEAAASTGGAGRAVREGGGCAEGGRADRPVPLRRERRGGRGARARWADWAERPRGGGEVGCFAFFFYSELFSPFLFLLILFDSNSNEPQIQIRLFENYAPNKSEI